MAALIAVEEVACTGKSGGGGGARGGYGRAGLFDRPAAFKLVYGPVFPGGGRGRRKGVRGERGGKRECGADDEERKEAGREGRDNYSVIAQAAQNQEPHTLKKQYRVVRRPYTIQLTHLWQSLSQ